MNPRPRINSSGLSASQRRPSASLNTTHGLTHALFFDNAQRFVTASNQHCPNHIALSAQWSHEREAAVTLAGLSPTSTGSNILSLKRKQLATALKHEFAPLKLSYQVSAIRNDLIDHSDVKPLAQISSSRSRYFAIMNSAEAANWAILDTTITVSSADMALIDELTSPPTAGDTSPYAVLRIRSDFDPTPAVVRAFDNSHLVQKVHDFTLGAMAIYTVQKNLPDPSWKSLLGTDIRKVPRAAGNRRFRAFSRITASDTPVSGISSGSSSTDDTANSSVFSSPRGHSCATSDDPVITDEVPDLLKPNRSPIKSRKKKHIRFQLPQRDPKPQRHWTEFDDGGSDVDPDIRHAIYADPDTSIFPSAEAASKAFAAINVSLSKFAHRTAPRLPPGVKPREIQSTAEREPLLGAQTLGDSNTDSSGYDTDEFLIQQRQKPKPSRRTATHGFGSSSRSQGVTHINCLVQARKLSKGLCFSFIAA